MSLLDQASLIVTPNGYKGGVTTGKLYSVKPTDASGDMVVSRGTSATRVNSAGLIELMPINVPRLDYTLGGCPSILVEPARTNLVLYSEEFDNAYWARSSTTITSNNTTAPDGTITADRLVLTGTNSTARVISRNVPITTVTTTVTFSTFVKYIDKQYLQLTFGSAFSSNFANFDLINEQVVGGTYGDAKIEPYPNGWYRISITSTGSSTTTCTAFIWVIDSAGALRAADSTSTGTSAYWIWGAQLEDGSNATSYIPTTTAQILRTDDVISKTGITTLIGQTEGTIFWDVKDLTGSTASGNPDFSIKNTAFTNWIGLTSNTPALPFRITVRPTTGSIIDYTSAITSAKACVKYGTFGAKLFLNGNPTPVATSAVNPNFSFDNILFRGSLFSYKTNSFALWKTALTDDQCISLTT
jgi:hypothetical protein